MNQIATWFGIITTQAVRRGTFTSVNALIRRIRAYRTLERRRRVTQTG